MTHSINFSIKSKPPNSQQCFWLNHLTTSACLVQTNVLKQHLFFFKKNLVLWKKQIEKMNIHFINGGRDMKQETECEIWKNKTYKEWLFIYYLVCSISIAIQLRRYMCTHNCAQDVKKRTKGTILVFNVSLFYVQQQRVALKFLYHRIYQKGVLHLEHSAYHFYSFTWYECNYLSSSCLFWRVPFASTCRRGWIQVVILRFEAHTIYWRLGLAELGNLRLINWYFVAVLIFSPSPLLMGV